MAYARTFSRIAISTCCMVESAIGRISATLSAMVLPADFVGDSLVLGDLQLLVAFLAFFDFLGFEVALAASVAAVVLLDAGSV